MRGFGETEIQNVPLSDPEAYLRYLPELIDSIASLEEEDFPMVLSVVLLFLVGGILVRALSGREWVLKNLMKSVSHTREVSQELADLRREVADIRSVMHHLDDKVVEIVEEVRKHKH